MEKSDQQKRKDNIERLVVLAQQGDSEAFAQIYDMFITPIYKYVYYRVGSTESEDLTELVFLKTWENIRQYKPGYRNFSSWIFRIAHNIVIDFYRSNRGNDELSENIEDHRLESSAKNMAQNHFDQKILNIAMKELKDEYRQILILTYINELNNNEIGHVMGRSQAAIRILKFRALRSLRRVLEKLGISEENA